MMFISIYIIQEKMKNLKIVKIKGGLGNQLFQYAFGRMLNIKYGFNVKYDLTQYSIKFNEANILRLIYYNVKLDKASEKEISRICRVKLNGNPHKKTYRAKIILNKLLNMNSYYFERNRLKRDVNKLIKYDYFDGYWQCEEYFNEIRETLLDELSLKDMSNSTKQIIKILNTQNAVFIGFRVAFSGEGKHLANRFNELNMNYEYYFNSMKYIQKKIKNPIFYIFSNNIEWVKKNISFPYDVIYREGHEKISDVDELIIMSNCKHAILSNSTFNWWGAWLIQNREKIIIVPPIWQQNKNNIIPENWIKYQDIIS